ncbi:MAG TPA: hypothetical protein VHC68_00285 [Candidatus Paceibacterota bacterium]|nr:hypothetical protein [Candidatus Paceibacterota bacterium]
MNPSSNEEEFERGLRILDETRASREEDTERLVGGLVPPERLVIRCEITLRAGTVLLFDPPLEATVYSGDNREKSDFCKKYAGQECRLLTFVDRAKPTAPDMLYDLRSAIEQPKLKVRFSDGTIRALAVYHFIVPKNSL